VVPEVRRPKALPSRRNCRRTSRYTLPLLVALDVVAVAPHRLGPSSSASTSTVDGRCHLRGTVDVAEIVVEVRGELYMGCPRPAPVGTS
jgi:hypothetical protein